MSLSNRKRRRSTRKTFDHLEDPKQAQRQGTGRGRPARERSRLTVGLGLGTLGGGACTSARAASSVMKLQALATPVVMLDSQPPEGVCSEGIPVKGAPFSSAARFSLLHSTASAQIESG